MGTARRLYLYAVSAVSLFVLAIGLYNLVALVLGELADAVGASVIGGGGSSGREQVSLAIALVAVGLPVFGIHWMLVGRGWRGTDASAVDDRFSALRAFHMALVATVAMSVMVLAGLQLLSRGLEMILGVDDPAFGARIPDALAMLAVAAPIWWYHQARRNLDLRHDRLGGPAAWLTRFYRYAWTLAGLLLLVVGTSQVVGTLASVAIGRSELGSGGSWWRDPLAWQLALTLVGSAVFAVHALDARRVIRDAAIIGEDDRATALRATYFGAVILIALADVAVTVASSLAGLGRWMLGVADASGTAAFLELVIGPLLVAIPFAVAGWSHWTAQRREAAQRSPVALAGAERIGLHLAALVGLTFLAVGSAQILGRLLEIALGSATVDDLFRSELAWYLAQVLVGTALWVPAWTMIGRRRLESPLAERRATTGRAYLYLVVGATLIVAVPSAAFVLYRVIDTLLGGRGIALGSDLAIPVAVVIVAALIAAYHGRILASDMRFVADAASATAPVVAPPSVPAYPQPLPEAAVATTLTLTLRGPAGTDLETVAASLRERLPAGVVLEAG